MGGAGSAVGEALQAAGVVKPLLQLGLPDEFIEHGDPAQLLALQGLDAAGIEASIRQRFADLVERIPPALKVVRLTARSGVSDEAEYQSSGYSQGKTPEYQSRCVPRIAAD